MARAQVIGIGMIGASIASALRAAGWHVSGSDLHPTVEQRALDSKLIDAAGIDANAEITFVATPVSSIADVACAALQRGGIVTDAGSVKSSVCASVDHARFVGGHPMAGSERSGIDGASASLFQSATWVLTPTDGTDDNAYMQVRDVITSLGANVVTVPPERHDRMVAAISHVPHLTAGALMSVALGQATSDELTLRLAAGGFRDMTRIAAGDPDLWTDIAIENRSAITQGLDQLIDKLCQMRTDIGQARSADVHCTLKVASQARRDLPRHGGRPADLTVLSIPIPDQPGALGNVLGILGTASINVEDIVIAHDPKGDRGTLEVTIANDCVVRASEALHANGIDFGVEEL